MHEKLTSMGYSHSDNTGAGKARDNRSIYTKGDKTVLVNSGGGWESRKGAWGDAKHGNSPEEFKEKGWTGRQKDMHKRLGKQLARESRRGSPSGPIEVDSRDGERPIDLRSISSQQTFREGWNGLSYSPPVSKIRNLTERAADGVEIKEF